MTVAPRASADGGGAGSAVPLPLDWPDSGPSKGFAVGPRVLREVANDIRFLASRGRPAPNPGWERAGAVGALRILDAEPGLWLGGRSIQYLHSQLREGVTGFYGALMNGLPDVASKLEETATNYEQAEQDSMSRLDRTSPPPDGTAAGPSVVGPDGRF